ncbi:MAG: amidohydrolase family protein [Bryobacteraceae bacterium]
MRRLDFDIRATRRDILKTMAVAGAGTLLPWESSMAQAPKRGTGKIDVHQHTRQPLPGQAPGNNPWTPEQTLEQMDKYGISVSVLSAINASRDRFYTPNTDAIAAARNSNEYHAKLVHDHPQRFGFFANLPINHTDASLKEIEYALDTLKADGIGLWTSTADGKYPGQDAFKPIWDEVNRRKLPVYLHPGGAPICCRSIDTPVSDAMLEFDFDVTRAAASLLIHGTLERNPDIKFILPHSGGAVPMLIGRMKDRVAASKRPELKPMVYDLFRKQYYEIGHAAFPFPFAAVSKLVPNSQLLFGTDFPAEPITSTTDEIPGLNLTKQQLDAIYRDNALRLFPRLKSLV